MSKTFAVEKQELVAAFETLHFMRGDNPRNRGLLNDNQHLSAVSQVLYCLSGLLGSFVPFRDLHPVDTSSSVVRQSPLC